MKTEDAQTYQDPDQDLPAPAERTESAALIALVMALIGFGIGAVIMARWAVRGGKRDLAVTLGWAEIIATVVIVACVVSVAAKTPDTPGTSTYVTLAAKLNCTLPTTARGEVIPSSSAPGGTIVE